MTEEVEIGTKVWTEFQRGVRDKFDRFKPFDDALEVGVDQQLRLGSIGQEEALAIQRKRIGVFSQNVLGVESSEIEVLPSDVLSDFKAQEVQGKHVRANFNRDTGMLGNPSVMISLERPDNSRVVVIAAPRLDQALVTDIIISSANGEHKTFLGGNDQVLGELTSTLTTFNTPQ